MADISNIYLVILAAGASRRFGKTDKLSALLRGKMLGLHISDHMANMGWGWRTVICADSHAPCAEQWQESGYTLHINAEADRGMGSSVALAAQHAQLTGAHSLMIMLADMPFVTAAHINAMLAAAPPQQSESLIASHNGDYAMPPALIGSDYWDLLTRLDGDKGARDLIKKANSVAADRVMLADIDTPDILAAYANVE